MRHLISPLDLSLDETNQLLDLAGRIIDDPEAFAHKCEGKQLATLFFEPSTRTRLSFESAMLSLGGKVLGFSSASSSSASKGETMADTIRVVSSYVDIIAMRHPNDGAPVVAADHSAVPIINAGDGGHHHPTQTLTDLLTIRRLKGKLDHLTIGFCGDLKYGRTVHSLIKAMCRYEGTRFVLISPDELKVPDYVRDDLTATSYAFQEVKSLEDAMGQLDVLYMTRIQKERFADEAEYLRLKDSYILDGAKMALGKKDMIVLHPLPRVNEIATEVDDDPRAAYFQQVWFGKRVRMALILKLLGLDPGFGSGEKPALPQPRHDLKCDNPRCISLAESTLPQTFFPTEEPGVFRCKYCDHLHKL